MTVCKAHLQGLDGSCRSKKKDGPLLNLQRKSFRDESKTEIQKVFLRYLMFRNVVLAPAYWPVSNLLSKNWNFKGDLEMSFFLHCLMWGHMALQSEHMALKIYMCGVLHFTESHSSFHLFLISKILCSWKGWACVMSCFETVFSWHYKTMKGRTLTKCIIPSS